MNRAQTKRKLVKLVNGKTVKPPKRGEPFGPWCEVSRRPTEMVEFGSFRGAAMLVWFFDDVNRVRILSDGSMETDHIVEKVHGKIDVRDEGVDGTLAALVRTGAEAASGLCRAFRAKEGT